MTPSQHQAAGRQQYGDLMYVAERSAVTFRTAVEILREQAYALHPQLKDFHTGESSDLRGRPVVFAKWYA